MPSITPRRCRDHARAEPGLAKRKEGRASVPNAPFRLAILGNRIWYTAKLEAELRI
jgi:hypothetical protein